MTNNLLHSIQNPCMSRKRARAVNQEELHNLLSVGISENALLKVLNKLKDRQPVATTTFKRNVTKALEPEAAIFEHKKLQADNGNDLDVYIANVPELLAYFCKNSQRYRRIFLQAVQRNNGTLTMLLYHDDIQTGNILAPSNAKKSTMVYLNFLEMNKIELLSPFSWLPVGVLTNKECLRAAAGLSGYMRLILRQLTLPLCQDGFILRCLFVTVKLEFGFFVSDYDAQRSTFLSRGAAGLKPCLHCSNILKKNSGVQDAFFRDISEPSLSNCVRTVDEELFAQLDRLRDLAGHGTKKQLEDLAFRLGFNYHPQGLVFDTAVRKILKPSLSIGDPMHCYLSNGIANVEIAYLLDLVKEYHLQLSDLENVVTELQLHCGTSNKQSKSWRKSLFAEKKVSDHMYKGPAWETELVLPLVLFCVSRLLGHIDRLQPMLSSAHFLQQCVRLVRLHLRFPFSTSTLATMQENHQKAFLLAYGLDGVRPKHHFRLHLVQSPLISCAPMEAKHREFKRNLGDRLQSKVHGDFGGVSKAALPRLLLTQIETIESSNAFPEMGLVPPTYESMELLKLLPPQLGAGLCVPVVSLQMHTHCSLVHKNDILFFVESGNVLTAHFVQCCFSISDKFFLVLENLISLGAKHFGDQWQRSHSLKIYGVLELPSHVHPLWWWWDSDDICMTLW